MSSIHEIDVDAEYTQTEQKEQFEDVNKELGVYEAGTIVQADRPVSSLAHM